MRSYRHNIHYKSPRLFFYLCAVVLIFMLAACSNTVANYSLTNPPTNTVTEIYAGFHCGAVSHAKAGAGRAPSIEWVADQLLLERAFSKLSKQFSTASTRAPVIDFKSSSVAIIYMGQQTSAGYSLQLARDEFRTYKGLAEITLRWKQPLPGMLAAQVITNPCVVVRLPVADYQHFQVVDTGGKVRVKAAALVR